MTQAKFLDYDEKEDYYDEEETKKPRRPGEAPDGGWGWIIVVGAFICSLLIEGLLYSFNEMKLEIADYYSVAPESLNMVSVFMAATALLAGPLTSGLVKKFGYRKVTMAGSCLTCASLLISTQMPVVELIHVTYGVLAGIGLNMVALPSVTIIAVWFEHKIAFATGLVVTGAGCGVFIFGPLIRHLLDNHDWKYTVLIVAAMFLNCAVAGALFRPLTDAKPKGMKRGVIQRGAIMKALIAEKERQRTISNGSLDNCIITKDNRLIKIDKIDLRNKSNSYINRLKETFGFSSRSLNRSKNSLVVPKVKVDPPIYRPKSPRSSTLCVNTPKPASSPPTPKRDSGSDSGCGSLENSPKLRSRSYEALPSDDPWDRNLVVKLPPATDNLSANASLSERNLSNLDSNLNSDSPSTSPKKQVEERLDPSFLSNNASPMGSLRSVCSRVRTVSNSTTHSKTNSICIPMHGGSVMTVPSMHSLEIYEEKEPSNCKMCHKVYKLLELDLLRSPTFCLLALTGTLSMCGFVIPFYHLPVKAMALEMSESKSLYLISIIWAAHMIARFIMGWIADRPVVSPLQLNNVMMVLAGFLSFFGTAYNNNAWLSFYAAFFGFFTATMFSLRSIICIQLLGKDRLVCSYGLLLFFQGIGLVIGHVMCNFLTSNCALLVVGACMMIAGLVGFPLVKVKEREGSCRKEFEIVHIEEISEMETLKVENCESTI